MSLSRTFHSGKRCFAYCGDDRCNCDASPHAPGNEWMLKGALPTGNDPQSGEAVLPLSAPDAPNPPAEGGE